jgi:excisionase family DNA binding protein
MSTTQHDPQMQSEPAAPRLLTVDQVAKDATISPRHVRQLILDGRLESIRIGRCVRVPRAAVDRLIASGTR